MVPSAVPRSPSGPLRSRPMRVPWPRRRRIPPSKHLVVLRPHTRQIQPLRTAGPDLPPRSVCLTQPGLALACGDKQILSRRLTLRQAQIFRRGRRPGRAHLGRRRPAWRLRLPVGPRIQPRSRRPVVSPSGRRDPQPQLAEAAGHPPASRRPQTRRPLAEPARRRRDSQADRLSRLLRGRRPAHGTAPPRIAAETRHVRPSPGGRHRSRVSRPAAGARPSGRWPPRLSPGNRRGGKPPDRCRRTGRQRSAISIGCRLPYCTRS
jgi:hypothetical protein